MDGAIFSGRDMFEVQLYAAELTAGPPPMMSPAKPMEPNEIFELIIKADEALKYATEGKATARAPQARRLLAERRDEARASGDEGLVTQAERRLADPEQRHHEQPGTA